MFMRDAVEIPCPDSAAGLYIKTRTDQIVKVYFLVLVIRVMVFAILYLIDKEYTCFGEGF